jgi:two-component system, cell cycle sensor histidine kinase and response regulator CckA
MPFDSPKGDETVLFVEDDELVRKLNLKILQQLGYEVMHAENGKSALAIAETYEGSIDLLITDVIMPEMNGEELARKISVLKPDIRILFTSGYTEDVIAPHGVLAGDIHFIGKPYKPNQLAVKIREVLDG